MCGLSFTQLSKHHNRIIEHLKTDDELANKLSLETTVTVENKRVKIEPVKMSRKFQQQRRLQELIQNGIIMMLMLAT